MSAIVKVPTLRFKEFDDEWKEERLDNVANFYDNKRIPLSQDERRVRQGKYPYYGASGVIDFIDDYIFDGEYILLGEDGANIINRNTKLAFVINGKFWINNHAHILQAKESNIFLAEVLEKINYEKYNTGTAQPKLNAEVCKSILFNLPSKQEQKKIASFLTSVDTKIEQLIKKEQLLKEYKKGVMQKIFSQEIRFKDDNGGSFSDWEDKNFGEVFTRITTKNKEDNQNVLTISAQQGLINQKKYFNKSVSAKDVTGYYLLHKDDFAYNKSYSKGYPMGAIKRLTNYDKGVVSTLYICFRAKDDNVSFIEQYFNNGNLNKELHKIAQEGARNHGLLNMSVIEFFNDMTLSIPSKLEQEKIASFLASIDTKIEQANEQLSQAKQFKKALLQQMFV